MITTPRDAALGALLRGAVDHDFEAAQVPWLQRVVDQPSHTHARADVEAAAQIVDEVAAELGLTRELHPDPEGRFADHRVYATPATGADDRTLALVGHIDTVFPRSLGFLSFSRDGDVVRGPGVLDTRSAKAAAVLGRGGDRLVRWASRREGADCIAAMSGGAARHDGRRASGSPSPCAPRARRW